MSKTTPSTVVVASYQSILESLQDQKAVETKKIQSAVKSNLKSLKSTIEKTKEDLETAITTRETLLESTAVNWGTLVDYDAKIEGYQKGLSMLKNYREVYFPNWKSTLTED